jgi:hypothetical protein
MACVALDTNTEQPLFRHPIIILEPSATFQERVGRLQRAGPNYVLISMVKFLLWLILLIVCWPLALLALVLYPIVWLILLPFRLVGIVVDGVFELLRSIVLLPARVLGARG